MVQECLTPTTCWKNRSDRTLIQEWTHVALSVVNNDHNTFTVHVRNTGPLPAEISAELVIVSGQVKDPGEFQMSSGVQGSWTLGEMTPGIGNGTSIEFMKGRLDFTVKLVSSVPICPETRSMSRIVTQT